MFWDSEPLLKAYFPRVKESEVDAQVIELENLRKNSFVPKKLRPASQNSNNSTLAHFPGEEENFDERETFLKSRSQELAESSHSQATATDGSNETENEHDRLLE
jgi:hypothetical protein